MANDDVRAVFYRKMIAEWETRLEDARTRGDYEAFAFAEREVANYRALLAQVGGREAG